MTPPLLVGTPTRSSSPQHLRRSNEHSSPNEPPGPNPDAPSYPRLLYNTLCWRRPYSKQPHTLGARTRDESVVRTQCANRNRRSSTVSLPVEAASPPTVLSNTSCFFSWGSKERPWARRREAGKRQRGAARETHRVKSCTGLAARGLHEPCRLHRRAQSKPNRDDTPCVCVASCRWMPRASRS